MTCAAISRTLMATAILALILSLGPSSAQSLSVDWPVRAALIEGSSYDIPWTAEGISSVSAVLSGERTRLGGASRGDYRIGIATAAPAENGSLTFTTPWLDSLSCTVKLKGYDSNGVQVASAERKYDFLPAVLADKTEDGIYLDLHLPRNQRLYVRNGGRLTRAYICSSSSGYEWLPPNRHISTPHDHAGVFRVIEKEPSHWSALYDVTMLWSLRYLGGHYIHATSRNLYRYLGRPASHGCNRLTRHDAQELYKMTPVGTRVEVIGPE